MEENSNNLPLRFGKLSITKKKQEAEQAEIQQLENLEDTKEELTILSLKKKLF